MQVVYKEKRENALNAMPNQDHYCETQPLSSGFPF